MPKSNYIKHSFQNTQVHTYQASAQVEEGAPLKVTGLTGEVTSFGTVVS